MFPDLTVPSTLPSNVNPSYDLTVAVAVVSVVPVNVSLSFRLSLSG